MENLFDQMIGLEALERAWHKVYRNAGAAGGDGISTGQFAADWERRLMRLAHELAAGLYQPGPIRQVSIPKKRGGMRRLSIPSVADRVVQTSAAQALSPLLDPHFEDSSYGYRPGRSAAQAARKVDLLRRQGYVWVVDGDLETYFDTIPHAQLMDRLARYVADERFLALIAQGLAAAGADGHGVPQGGPISPLLSNLYLDDIDEAIERHGVRLVRFADDFVLLCKSQAKAADALERMQALCAGHGLRLNPEKTRIVGFDEAFSFLGKKFVRSLMVDSTEDEAAHGNRAVATAPKTRAATEKATASGPELILIKRSAAADAPPAAHGDAAPPATIRPLYVLEPGRRVHLVNGGTLGVEEEGRPLLRLPLTQVGRLELGPHVEAEDSLLRAAAGEGIAVHFLDGYGGLLASLTPSGPGDSALHLAQARYSFDPDLRLTHAAGLVAGRLANAHALLKRLNRRRKLDSVQKATKRLSHLRRKTQIARSLDQLRGMEGEGAALYWRCLNDCLEHGWRFPRRARHPAPDPVNAVLDWTAALLARDVSAAVSRAGLHPGFGTLHAEGDNREACVFDLIEEFRAPLAEGLSLYLFNNRILGKAHFNKEGDGVRFVAGAGPRLIERYENWLARPVRNPQSGEKQSWRDLILFQARHLADSFLSGQTYQPYRMDF